MNDPATVGNSQQQLGSPLLRRQRDFVVREWRRDPKLDFKRPRFAPVGERLELASIERRQSWSDEPFFNQMIAIPNMLRAREAEEMISNATTGCGELDLLTIRNCVPI